MLPRWAPSFLSALADTGVVTDACRAADISTSTAYGLRSTDADFAAAWEQAREDAADTLEREALRRAVRGVQEPVVYQGQLTPVWARHADGRPVMESYDAFDKDGAPSQAYRPVQEVDADGRPVWLTITKYSDPLLALLLKGRRKKVFADRTELTGADGGDLKVVDSTVRAARVAHLMAIAAQRKAAADEFGDLA